jgi:hypothetical protein
VPFTTMLVVVIIWFVISVPLSLAGSWLGFKQGDIAAPVRTNQIPRQIPPVGGYLRPLPSMAVAGVLPFGAIFVELYFIMNSIWFSKVYYMFGFLFLCFGLMIITSAAVTVLMIYFLLCAENYHWQWRSFFTAGASAAYVFASCLLYWIKAISWSSWTSGVVYLGYSALLSGLMFVLTGECPTKIGKGVGTNDLQAQSVSSLVGFLLRRFIDRSRLIERRCRSRCSTKRMGSHMGIDVVCIHRSCAALGCSAGSTITSKKSLQDMAFVRVLVSPKKSRPTDPHHHQLIFFPPRTRTSIIPNPSRALSSSCTTLNGNPAPTPNNTNAAHFHRNGLIAIVNTNQYISSEYVKKSKAPLGAALLMNRVMSIHFFIHHVRGCASKSTKYRSRKRV